MPRPQRITRDLLLRAALDLVDAEGLEALTMRELGRRVGADPAMVYRMFDGKDDLVEALADRVYAEIGALEAASAPVPYGPGPAWAATLHAVAHAMRHALLAHPALIPAAIRRPPLHEATLAGTDALLGLLRGAGLEPRAAAAGFQAVLYHVLGFVAIEAPHRSMSAERSAAEWNRTAEALAGLAPQEFPHIVATREYLFTADMAGQFDHGLRLLLRGLTDGRLLG